MIVFPLAVPQHVSAASRNRLSALLCSVENTAASISTEQIESDRKSGSGAASRQFSKYNTVCRLGP